MLTKVAVELVNGELRSDRQIAAETRVPRVIVEHVFDLLESQDAAMRTARAWSPRPATDIATPSSLAGH